MKQRTAIITGATSGMGSAVARLFASQNKNLLITGRNQQKLLSLSEELGKTSQIWHKSGDISNPVFVNELLSFAYNNCTPMPSIYILSAGMGLPGTILSSDPVKWRQMIELNYISVLYQLRHCAEYFIKNQISDIYDIVVIGSTAGRNPAAANSVYASTKAVLNGLVDSLRMELCQHSIRVTLIEPGFTKSSFQETANYSQATMDKLHNEVGQLLQPEDIANAIGFVVDQAPNVHIDNLRIRPLRQK